MRLDHFVQLPKTNLKTKTGDTMSNNALTTPSITKSRGFGSSHNTWVNTMRFNRASEKTRVWGRIKDTGANFIVEGWKVAFHPNRTEWVQIPCANLATAQMHLISVMDKLSFEIEKTRNANGI